MSFSLPTGRRRRLLVVVAPTVAAALLLAACSSSKKAATAPTSAAPAATTSAAAAPPASASSAAPASAASAAPASAAAGSGAAAAPQATTCADYAQYTSAATKGKTVTMFGSILPPESDSLNKSWAQFESCTGIKISYEGSNDFESQLPVRVQGGTAPDLAIIPQPGLLQQMVALGAVKAPPAGVVANEDKYWNAAWKSYATVNGTFYGAPQSANLKSLVWYSPSAMSKAGYTIPTTWDQLASLSDKIAATGTKPWCGGLGSGTATGWPATDWLEETVLSEDGGQVYDDWVSHKITFEDPKIESAMQDVANWMQNPKWVNGGYGDVKTIATTTFQDAGKPILTGQCWFLQQASFYEAQWPTGTTVSPTGQVWAFYLPPRNTTVPTPVEGGGEFTVAFASDAATQAVQTYLSSPQWADSRIKVAPGWVSANSGVDQSLYTDGIDKLSAQYLTNPNATFRFDASDLMPSAVGSGAEWTQMTAWFGSGASISSVAKAIDAAWPAS